jgi:hypothetical protein
MKKAFSIIFIFLLLVPAVVWLIGLNSGTNTEGKKPTPLRPYGDALFSVDYYRSFDQYFNRNFSLRRPLTVAKNWLDYHLFRTTDATGVHIGKSGWLYSRKAIDDYRKEACKDSTDMGRLFLELQALERIIEASGRRFFFIVAPNKSTVYPEYVGFIPDTTQCSLNRYDLLLKNMAEYPLGSFVRLDEELRNAKERGVLLYDKTSTCWNGLGALVAAQTIRQRIVDGQPEQGPMDLRVSGTAGMGDLYAQVLRLTSSAEDRAAQALVNRKRPHFPTGLVYGDAFTRNLLPYAGEMFNQLDVITSHRVPSRQHGEDLRGYDLILLERAESELAALHIDLEEVFSLLEPEITIPERYPLPLGSAAPLSHISLEVREDGLQVKSMGSQSSFELTSVPGSCEGIFKLLKLTIAASHSNIMTVTPVTDMAYAVPKSLKQGITEILVPLPYQETLSLRIQPGAMAGLFVLRSAEIYGFRKDQSVPEPPPDSVTAAKTDEETEAHPLRQGSTAASSEPAPKAGFSSLKSVEAATGSGSELFASKGSETSTPEEPTSKVADRDAQQALMDSDRKEIIALTRVEIDDPITVTESLDVLTSEKPELLYAQERALEVTDQVAEKAPVNEDSEETTALSKVEIDDPITVAQREEPIASFEDSTPDDILVLTQLRPSITLADFDQGRIFQRKGSGTGITVSGTYAGMPEAIEARVVRDQSLEEIVPWTTIDASPKNGIFLGVLPHVPQGGWYNIQVRYANDHAVLSSGIHRWGVGILVGCLGQSNMKEWFYTGTTLGAHALLQKFDGKGWAELGRTGNAAIAFGNMIIERLGIPVGLLDFSKNGSGLRKEADFGTGYWEDTSPGSIYNRFVSGVSETGGALEYVLWVQGEADAARGTVTEDEYAQSLESFITNQIRADISNGSCRKYLPFLVIMMVKRPGGKNKPNQAIRNAQKRVAEHAADCYLAATTLDLKNQGKQHLSPEAYITMGRRVAQTVLYILGEEKYYRGPEVAGVKRLDDRTIEVRLHHRGGTDFTPDSGISGWEILTDGAPLPIAEVYRHDPRTIKIMLKKPLNGTATVRYLYGAMPDVSHPVLDNSAMHLPLEEYQSELQ